MRYVVCQLPVVLTRASNVGPIIRTPPPCPAVNTPVANDCLFLKYWLITTSPAENVQLDPKPNRRLYVKKRTIMFSTKELAIKLTTQNAPPIRVVIRQPNRLTRAVDRWPVKNVMAMATEPTHAEKSNKYICHQDQNRHFSTQKF
ncbi:hypothetical protein OS493_005350 [Desmophyllum pertusum]|uniref:Uncharacterized protein n=1 Tax=Desmophyllum pertusum TaxID=174260 RepID=A0A9W9YS76_9CNID|nr:hypothetical protein OS493_005350 [Desmophyllum pertusum]